MNNTLSDYRSDTTIDSDDVPTYESCTSDYSFKLFSDIDPYLNLNTSITNSYKYYSYEQFNGIVSGIVSGIKDQRKPRYVTTELRYNSSVRDLVEQ